VAAVLAAIAAFGLNTNGRIADGAWVRDGGFDGGSPRVPACGGEGVGGRGGLRRTGGDPGWKSRGGVVMILWVLGDAERHPWLPPKAMVPAVPRRGENDAFYASQSRAPFAGVAADYPLLSELPFGGGRRRRACFYQHDASNRQSWRPTTVFGVSMLFYPRFREPASPRSRGSLWSAWRAFRWAIR